MKCKFCSNIVEEGKQGYLMYLDDAEFSRLQSLRLIKGENLCISCKREIMFAGLDLVLN